MRIGALIVLACFYGAYITKMILQHKQGITTDQLGKGNKPKRVKLVETALRMVSYCMVVVALASVVLDLHPMPQGLQWTGILLASIGVVFFVGGMTTMRNNWRAGIPEKDKTQLVTHGIFRISRNPAFVGFDLLYFGIAVAFPNIVHLIMTMAALVLFHQQILLEETFLKNTFGEQYQQYAAHTCRYVGRK